MRGMKRVLSCKLFAAWTDNYNLENACYALFARICDCDDIRKYLLERVTKLS